MASLFAVWAGPPIPTAGITGGAVGGVDDVGDLSDNLSVLSLSPLPMERFGLCTSPLTGSLSPPTASPTFDSSVFTVPHAGSISAPAYSSRPRPPPAANDAFFTCDSSLRSLASVLASLESSGECCILAEFSNQPVIDNRVRGGQLCVPKAAKATSAKAKGGKGGKDARGKGVDGGAGDGGWTPPDGSMMGPLMGGEDPRQQHARGQAGGAVGSTSSLAVRRTRQIFIERFHAKRKKRRARQMAAGVRVGAYPPEERRKKRGWKKPHVAPVAAATSLEAEADEMGGMGGMGGMGAETDTAREEKRKRRVCPHGNRRERCVECGGNQVCIHGKVKDKRYPCQPCREGTPASLVRTTSTATNVGVGVWSPKERRLYQDAVALFGANEWRSIASHVGTRTSSQARTHGVRTRRGKGSGGGGQTTGGRVHDPPLRTPAL